MGKLLFNGKHKNDITNRFYYKFILLFSLCRGMIEALKKQHTIS